MNSIQNISGTSTSCGHNLSGFKQGSSRSTKSDQDLQSTVAGGEIFSTNQVDAIPILITETIEQDGANNGPTIIVTPVQQIINTQSEFTQFQPQTIAVAPLNNTAYTFTM